MVLGLTLLSLTPAAPGFLRFPELLAVHLFRPLDAAVLALRNRPRADRERPLDPSLVSRIQAGLRARDEMLLSGAREFAPNRPHLLARVVAFDAVHRRLLVDAGAGARLKPGDAVTAGHLAVGRVEHAQGGVAVVETPFSPNRRFDAACSGEDRRHDLRFVIKGLNRGEWSAAVTSPERKSKLLAGADVIVPEVGDLVPETVPTLPPGLRMGRLVKDLTLARTGHRAFCVEPVFDLRLLDAVVVLPTEEGEVDEPTLTFEITESDQLVCGLATPWRDGRVVLGFGLPAEGAVSVEQHYVGRLEVPLLGACQMRGVFDPGQVYPVLVIEAGDAWTALVRSVKSWTGGGRLEVVHPGRSPPANALLVTAGRGWHQPRGLLIGRVERNEGGNLDVMGLGSSRCETVRVHRRNGFPTSPWGS